MNRLKLTLFFMLTMNFSQAICMGAEIAFRALERSRERAQLERRRQAELERQKPVSLAVKSQYGLQDVIDSKVSDDVRIIYLTKVLRVSDLALPAIEAERDRSNRVLAKENFGTFLQYALTEVASEGSYTGHYIDNVIQHNSQIDCCQDSCWCMPWCVERESTNFVQESKRQVEDKLESLKPKVVSQQQFEMQYVSNIIHDEERS